MPRIVDVKFSELANFTERQTQAWEESKLYDYLLFGGAGSGGKSYLLRWWCLRQLLVRYSETRIPGLRVGLFSMDYPTLQDRQISKIKREFPDWLGSLKETRSDGYNFALKPEYGGGTIALRNLDDPSKYKSSEFCDIAVEELTENDKDTFDDLRFRLRWPGVERPKFIAATNPTGRGHAWVKALWIDRKFPPEMEAIKPQFRYVPALPKDNPHVTDAYEITLRSLPPAKRKALLEGDWSIPEGQYFTNWNRSERAIHPSIVSQIIQPWWPKWIGQDWGFGHHSPVLWHTVGNVSPKMAKLMGRNWDVPKRCVFTYREHVISLKETNTTELELGQEVAELSRGEKINEWILSRDAFGEKTSQHTPAELLHMGGKPSLPSPQQADMKAGSRVSGWRFMYQLIQNDEWFVSEMCPELIEAIPSLEYDTDKNGEDVRKTNHMYDDIADCARYGLADMLNTVRAPLKVRAAEKAEELGITEPQLQDKTADERSEIISVAAVQLKKFYADDKKKKRRRAQWASR